MTKVRPGVLIGGILLITALLSCHSESSDEVYDRTHAEAEIGKIERDWAEVAVTGDPGVIERIFADDFVGVSPDGVQYTKRGFIDDTKANPLGFRSNEVNQVKVRFFGNVAVAQGDETFTTQSGDRGRFVWTDVLVRREGGWQIVAAQDAMAPADSQPTVAALFAGAEASAAARREIDKTRAAYVSAWRAANSAQIAELYAEDAFVLYPSQPPVMGRSAIVAYFDSFFGDFPRNEFELESSEVTVTGDWAFDRGSYRWRGFPRSGGPPEDDEGKYLVILQRAAEGTWRVARDMDNSNRPASQASRGVR